jgi:hypothetical protein
MGSSTLKVPLDQPAQQLDPIHMHHGLQLTMGYAPGLLACETAQQVLKLRTGIRVVLDRTGCDRISGHRPGPSGVLQKIRTSRFTPQKRPRLHFVPATALLSLCFPVVRRRLERAAPDAFRA